MACQGTTKNMSISQIDQPLFKQELSDYEWAAQFEEPTESKPTLDAGIFDERYFDDIYDYEEPVLRRSSASKRRFISYKAKTPAHTADLMKCMDYLMPLVHNQDRRIKESRAKAKSKRSRSTKTCPIPLKNTCRNCGLYNHCNCLAEAKEGQQYNFSDEI